MRWPFFCSLYPAVGGKSSMRLLDAQPWCSKDLSPIVMALGVASLSDVRNSLKRSVRPPIATTNGNVHFLNARSSSFLRLRILTSVKHSSPIARPCAVNRYSGRIGCPCPGFFLTKPSSTRCSRAALNDPRLASSVLTRVINLAPDKRNSSAMTRIFQR